MGELNTIFGGDDTEFRRTAAAVDSRITSFVDKTKGVSGAVRNLFKLGGVLGAVAGASELARKFNEIQQAAEGAGSAIRGMGQDVVNTLRPRDSSLSVIDQQISDFRESVGQRKKTLEQEAIKQHNELQVRDFNPFTKMIWQAVTGKNTDEQLAEIASAKDQELKRISDFAERKEKEMRRNYRDQQLANLKKNLDDYGVKREARVRSFNDDLVDTQISVAERAGLGMEAEDLARKERLRRQMRDIDEDKYLTAEEKKFSRAFYERSSLQDKAASDQARQEQYEKQAGSISGSAGGSTFGQQIAGISNALGEAKKQSELQKEIAASLKTLANDIGNRSFTTYN